MKLFGEYEDKKLGAEYLELVTDIKTLLNYGKYSGQVISDSPDWEGTEGETLYRYQVNGTGWFYYQYFWVNSGWSFLRWTNSGNALVVDNDSITTDMIQNNAITIPKIGFELGTTTTYVGDGNDNRTVAHSLGRTPIMVWVSKNETDTEGTNIWMYNFGAKSRELSSGASRTDCIKAVDGTNVTLGTNAEVNTLNKNYCVFCI